MIKEKNLRDLSLSSIEEYFEYILDSRTNGQHTQAKELFNELSVKQKDDFFEYVVYIFGDDDRDDSDSSIIKEYFKK